MKCEAVISVSPETGEQKECQKEATYSAYDGTVFFCDECLHDCMQDASPEENASVKCLLKSSAPKVPG